MYHVYLPVIIKEKSRIVKVIGENCPGPGSPDIAGSANRKAPLFSIPSRGAESYKKETIMVPDRGGPGAPQVHISTLEVITAVLVITIHGVTGHAPVNKIF
jgi:hypothetical protein